MGIPAGGPTDVIARLIAHKLSEQLGRNFYVENVTGAGGAVATAQVANSAPDGHTLLFVTNDFSPRPHDQQGALFGRQFHSRDDCGGIAAGRGRPPVGAGKDDEGARRGGET